MQGLTKAGRQDVITTGSQHGTVNFRGVLNRGRSHLNGAGTEQIGGVILSGGILRIGTHRHAVVHDNGVAVPVGDVDSTLDASSISVLPELQQVLLRKIQSDLGMHDSHAEDTGIITNGLLDSLSRRSFADVVRLTGSTGSTRELNIGGMQLPGIPVIGLVISETEDTVHDTDQAVLTLLVPVLRNLRSDLLHRVGTGVEVVKEVLITPRVHTTIDDTSLRTTGRISNGHIGSTIVVVISAPKDIVERDGVQVGTVSNHPSNLGVLLNSTTVDHSGPGGILGRAPV
nr:MAG TPA: hypothetical protein [Caudoviricetes sp.]